MFRVVLEIVIGCINLKIGSDRYGTEQEVDMRALNAFRVKAVRISGGGFTVCIDDELIEEMDKFLAKPLKAFYWCSLIEVSVVLSPDNSTLPVNMDESAPNYSEMSPEELWDCWLWVDDIAYPERAIELYERVYSEDGYFLELDAPSSESNILSLLFGGSSFGGFALRKELELQESRLRLKKARVEKLLAERSG